MRESPTYEELKSKVEDLEKELGKIYAAQERRKRVAFKSSSLLAKAVTRVFLGSALYQNTQQLWDAWRDWLRGNRATDWPENETRDFIASLLSRFIRVGFVGLFVLLLPFLFLLLQTALLYQQNKLLQSQNQLVEASRRATLLVELTSILDHVDLEIQENEKLFSSQKPDDSKNVSIPTNDNEERPKWVLSKRLIGRIIALSRALRPYRSLDYVYGWSYSNGHFESYYKDVLRTWPLSPERGQLLISLLESGIDMQEILKRGDFSYSDLRDLHLVKVDLRDANLIGSHFTGSNLTEAILTGARLGEANFTESNLHKADLKNANLSYASFTRAYLETAELNGARVSKDWVTKYEKELGSRKKYWIVEEDRRDNALFYVLRPNPNYDERPSQDEKR